MTHRLALLFLVVAGLVLSGTARAQARQLRLTSDAISIIGEVRKPEVTIFITKQNLNASYDLVLKESFIPKIVTAADRKPF